MNEKKTAKACLSSRPSFEAIAKILLDKCEKIAVENKPDYLSAEDSETFLYQFRLQKPEEWMTLYKQGFEKLNNERKAAGKKELDKSIFIWDQFDLYWPFLKDLKGEGVEQLDKVLKLLLRLFDSIV